MWQSRPLSHHTPPPRRAQRLLSSGPNVIPRRARPGLAGLRPHTPRQPIKLRYLVREILVKNNLEIANVGLPDRTRVSETGHTAHRLLYHSTLGLREEKKGARTIFVVPPHHPPLDRAAFPRFERLPVSRGPTAEGSYLRRIDFCITQL